MENKMSKKIIVNVYGDERNIFKISKSPDKYATEHLKINDYFKEGQFYKKISRNLYFNCGEIIVCTKVNKGKAFFTSERLKTVHQYNDDYGIELENEEEFEVVTDHDLKFDIAKTYSKHIINLLEIEKQNLLIEKTNIINKINDVSIYVKQFCKNNLREIEEKKKEQLDLFRNLQVTQLKINKIEIQLNKNKMTIVAV